MLVLLRSENPKPPVIPPAQNIAVRLQRVFQERLDDAQVTYLDRRGRPVEVFTGRRLLEMARKRAAALEAIVPAGATCLLVMPAGPEFLLTLLGCLFAGVVAVPLPEPGSGAHSERLDGVLETSGAAAVLCVSDNFAALEAHIANAEGVLKSPLFALDAAVPADSEPVCAGMGISSDETVIVQYTSGSTRDPKGIALSSGNILANAALIFGEWQLAPGTPSVNWLPHYHDMGLLGGILYPMVLGYDSHSIQMSPWAFLQHPFRWLQVISQFRAGISGAPAFALGLCVDHITDEQLQQLDLSCWQVAFCGAEPISVDILQRFRTRFASAGFQPGALYATYGLAESTLFVAGHPQRLDQPAPPEDAATRIAPARLSAETRPHVKIVDPETLQQVPDGTVGEVWVTGASVSRGYLPAEAEMGKGTTFGAILPGDPLSYLRSGDLGWIGPGGLYISGRMKDMLIANGANVAATDVEWLAAEHHPELNALAAAAVAVAVDEGQEKAALLIEVRSSHAVLKNAASLADEIRLEVRARYSIDLVKVEFLKRGSLERTTSGKIRRQKVAERLRTGHAYPQANSSFAE